MKKWIKTLAVAIAVLTVACTACPNPAFARKVYSENIYSEEINSQAIDSGEIYSEAIDNDKTSGMAVDSGEISAEAIDCDAISGETIDSNEIYSETIDNEAMSGEAIDSNEIYSETIDNDAISGETIDSDEISGETVDLTENDETDSETIDLPEEEPFDRLTNWNGDEAHRYLTLSNGDVIDLKYYLSYGYDTVYVVEKPREGGPMLRSVMSSGSTYTVSTYARADDLFLGNGALQYINDGTAILAMGVKVILNESDHPDSGGKTRYAYCLEYSKDSPDRPSVVYSYSSWKQNLAIVYAMDHGARYYGECNPDTRYGVGIEAGNNDYIADYWITQSAVHILNGEYSLTDVQQAISGQKGRVGGRGVAWNANGTYLEGYGHHIYSKLSQLISDARKAANLQSGYVDGYIDSYFISTTRSVALTNEGFANDWYFDEEEGYYRTGWFTPTFKQNGTWFNNYFDTLDMSIDNEDIGIYSTSSGTVRQCYLYIYPDKLSRLSGASATLTTSGTAWGQWGVAVFYSNDTSQAGRRLQNLAIIDLREPAGKATVRRTDEVRLPVINGEITVKKTISADKNDIWWEHGSPIFQIRVICTEKNGHVFSLYHTFVFKNEYVYSNADEYGNVSMSYTFTGLSAGTVCDVSEIRVSRYNLTEIASEDASAVFGIYEEGDPDAALCYPQHVTVTAYPEGESIPITFSNEKQNYRNLSHTASVINVIE